MSIHPQAKRLAVLVVAAMVASLIVGWAAVRGGSAGAQAFCDVKSLKTLAHQTGEPHDATYYLQQAQACEGTTVTSDGKEDSSPKTLPGANPTSSKATSKPKSKPKSSSKTTTSSAPKQAAYVFYANSKDKAAPNDFGPQHAVAPKLTGAKSQNLNLQQGVKELEYRISRDPMLTAAYWCQFNLKVCNNNGVTADAKTKLYMHDKTAWKAAKATVLRKIDAAVKAGKVKREVLPAGWYTSTYALHGDSFPAVRSGKVYRNGDATMSGLMFTQYGFFSRFVCGFQIYTWTQAKATVYKPLPKPSPGMTRTVEGVPEKLVWVCNPATGKQIQVPVSKKSKYPPNTGKCKPVTATSTTTTPGTPTSTSTPPPPLSTTPPPPTSTTHTTPPTTPPTTTPPTTPPPSSSSMPPKCPPGNNDPACHSLPPGSSGTPTNNPPSSEPVPTHTGPTYNPTETSTPTATSTPSTSRTTPPNEGPDPTSTATGGPTGCAVCGD